MSFFKRKLLFLFPLLMFLGGCVHEPTQVNLTPKKTRRERDEERRERSRERIAYEHLEEFKLQCYLAYKKNEHTAQRNLDGFSLEHYLEQVKVVFQPEPQAATQNNFGSHQINYQLNYQPVSYSINNWKTPINGYGEISSRTGRVRNKIVSGYYRRDGTWVDSYARS